MKTVRLSEKAFQAQVVQLAKLCGWKVYHTHDSRRSEKGFPDLVMVRTRDGDRRVVAAELKVGRNRPTDEQHEWMLALSLAGLRTVLWYPENWDEIEEILGAK